MKLDFRIVDCSPVEIAFALNRSQQITLNSADFSDQQILKTLTSLHKKLFIDLYNCEDGKLRPGFTRKHEDLKVILKNLNTSLKQLRLTPKKISKIFAEFFIKFSNIKPFAYGNHFTARKFLVELSRTLVNQEILDKIIDFRNLDENELKETLDLDELSSLFYKLLIGSNPHIEFDCEEWPELPDSAIEIAGYRFLSYDKQFLVAQNGGLIEADAVSIDLERFLKRGGHPYDYKLSRDAFENFLFNDDEPISTLDGIPFESEIPLICLDVDYMTGLTFGREFKFFQKHLAEKKLHILDVPEYVIEENIKNKILTRAAANISEVRSFIEIVKNKYLSGVTEATGIPKFFMCMGGIGAGKSSLEKHANIFTGNNIIRVSVDNVRAKSKLYDFYLECNHHSDDYKILSYFSNVVIEEILDEALKKRYNIFKDTSGIPYKGKNEQIIKKFKRKGYETYVLSAASALYVEEDRKDLNLPAHIRIMNRYEKKNRAIPWDIVTNKHVNHPLAQADALLDDNLDYVLIYDTMVEKGKTHILAKTIDINEYEHEQITAAKKLSPATLFEKIQELEIVRFEELPEDFKIENIDFIVNQYDSEKEIYQILVILNKIKMLDFIQKGALNLTASGYEELVFNTHPEHNPSIDYPAFKRPNQFFWRLRNQTISKS